MGAIIASFQMQYGIDLYEQRDKMKYQHFMTLLTYLNRDTPMGYRMYLRNGEGLSDEEKKLASKYFISQTVERNEDGSRATTLEEKALFQGLLSMAKKKEADTSG